MRSARFTTNVVMLAAVAVALACSVSFGRAYWNKTGIGCCWIASPPPANMIKWYCPQKPGEETCIDQLIDNFTVSHAVLGTASGNEDRITYDQETCKWDSYECNFYGYCVLAVPGRMSNCTPTDPDGATPPC